MAKDAISTIITVGIIGVAGYFAYTSGLLSSFFPSSVPPPAPPPTPPPAGSGAGTNPVNTGGCGKSGVLGPWLSSIQAIPQVSSTTGTFKGSDFGPGQPGTMTVDEYCYYGNQKCTGICDQNGLTAEALFPGQDDRGGPLNWSAFLGKAQAAGLSGVGRGLMGTHLARRIS